MPIHVTVAAYDTSDCRFSCLLAADAASDYRFKCLLLLMPSLIAGSTELFSLLTTPLIADSAAFWLLIDTYTHIGRCPHV